MKQLTAEQLMTIKTRQGFQRLEWQQTRERNEALDCRVYRRHDSPVTKRHNRSHQIDCDGYLSTSRRRSFDLFLKAG